MPNKKDRYTYRVIWSEEDGEYVGLCDQFSLMSWLAKTEKAALKGIKKAVKEAVADMQKNGEPIP